MLSTSQVSDSQAAITRNGLSMQRIIHSPHESHNETVTNALTEWVTSCSLSFSLDQPSPFLEMIDVFD